AEPHAMIGIGMREVMSRDALRAAALDGSIEDKLFWKAVKAGDVFYSPAGTVHAIGPGLTLVEVQQNVDLTYRLYDYGRPRELHLDEGVAVSDPVPYVAPFVPIEAAKGRLILADGPAFVLEHWARSGSGMLDGGERKLWLAPIKGEGAIDGKPLKAGSNWLIEGAADLSLDHDSEILVAYPGKGVIRDIWQ
ncbi:MAG: phosphoheptose isomerase, partial [Sphingomonadaceae bacterium]